MTLLRKLYLLLAIVGTVVPMYFFISWFLEFGFDIGGMMQAWNVNDASSGLVWDLTIAAITLNIWIIVESITRRDWLSLLVIPTIYCIGVSCALPLYLFVRSRERA
ncbi:MAG: DUF2834 domain-containing protein [Rhodobacteraceae bacterium]|nr:DUF2834 domain-containing protein [Paracoccaceae bacterium]